MNYEVEQKFPVADLAAVEVRLAALGAGASAPHEELDQYYNHPARDFAATDEALRIRRTESGCAITYKGPKVDATTKTRHELELAIPAEQAAHWAELLAVLGFRPVTAVRKQRRKASVAWQGRRVEVSLDDVAEVGRFVELELIADEHDREPARACLAALAAHLGLTAGERRSYLELLLLARSV